MDYKQEVSKVFSLKKKMKCGLDCYKLSSNVFLIFWDDIITHESVDALLNRIEKETDNQDIFPFFRTDVFPYYRTFVIIGETNEEFEKEMLAFFNSVGIFVTLYLFNHKDGEIYYHDSFFYLFGMSGNKIVKKLNKFFNVKK